MGTAISVHVRGDADLDPVFDWLRWVDATFSTYREDSAISRGDHSDPRVREVLDRCGARRAATSTATRWGSSRVGRSSAPPR
jgi:thiamine biosynthesis lipoprotein